MLKGLGLRPMASKVQDLALALRVEDLALSLAL